MVLYASTNTHTFGLCMAIHSTANFTPLQSTEIREKKLEENLSEENKVKIKKWFRQKRRNDVDGNYRIVRRVKCMRNIFKTAQKQKIILFASIIQLIL